VPASAFRACWANKSRTGVEACSFLPASVPDAVAGVLPVVLFALGMPRFSARLVAIDDCGKRRRDVGAPGEDVDDAEVRVEEDLGGGDAVDTSEVCFAPSLFGFSLRGASLIKPASLR
jgi:hypothetical protein